MGNLLLNLIPEAEMARERDVSIPTLRRERKNGGGPPFRKIGRKVFYPRDRFEQWLSQDVVTSNAELEMRRREASISP
jgi:hypothetical protein